MGSLEPCVEVGELSGELAEVGDREGPPVGRGGPDEGEADIVTAAAGGSAKRVSEVGCLLICGFSRI